MNRWIYRILKKTLAPGVTVYRVEDMHCSHCEAAVVRAVEEVQGVEKAKASAIPTTCTNRFLSPAPMYCAQRMAAPIEKN